jgi:hypothetical protein
MHSSLLSVLLGDCRACCSALVRVDCVCGISGVELQHSSLWFVGVMLVFSSPVRHHPLALIPWALSFLPVIMGNFGEACHEESSTPCVIVFFPDDTCFCFLDFLEGVFPISSVHAVPDVYDYIVNVFFSPDRARASGGVVEKAGGRH